MIVLSLFDGMRCGLIALTELGVKVDKYYSSEIDKIANQQGQHNFPNVIQLGDVTKWREWNIDFSKIDLLMGGSPCQGFSFAGKQLNFSDERSKLFFVYVDIWNHIKKLNPNAKFLLENVNMKKEYLRVISEYLGVFPVRINSNLVSAQNRDRWYWSNIRTKETGLFAELWTDIPQPADRKILLKDILQPESEVESKYYMSDKMMNYLSTRKASCINASSKSVDISDNFIKADKQGVKKIDQNKAGCLTGGGHSGGNHSDMDIICVAMRGRNPDNSSDRKTGSPTEQRLEPKTDGKTNCLTSVAKDNLIASFPKRAIDNVRNDNDKAQCLLSTSHKGAQANGMTNVTNGYKLRRLTPTECSRLQTIPEWYEWIVSDTQIYKMLGNGWTVEVIKHILSFI